jgi:hypothetical protein
MRRMIWIAFGLVGLVLLAAGCGGDGDSDEELPEARPLLETATGRLQAAASFFLEIDVDGYPVKIGTGGMDLPADVPLTFDFARGGFVAPDRIQADVQIRLGDFATTAQIIAIGPDQYLKSELLTQSQWIEQQIIAGFNPASLMAEEGGIAHALEAVTGLETVVREDLDGIKVYHLRGQIAASEVNALTFGLIATQDGQLDIDIFIHADDQAVEQIVLHEPLPEGVEEEEPTTWTISIRDYDEAFTINPPISGEGS